MQETTVMLLNNEQDGSFFVQAVGTQWLTYFDQTLNVQFTLVESPAGAAFLDQPIQWDIGRQPIDSEWDAEVAPGGQSFTLRQNNVNEVQNTRVVFGFRIGLTFQGTTYWSEDPTIMNQGPVGGIIAPPIGPTTLQAKH